jgi:hypothetical protein
MEAIMKRALLPLVVLAALAAGATAVRADEPAPPPEAAASPARKACTDAMNADPQFANAIVKTINEQTAQQHIDAAEHIATNEKHVILAYAAMWVAAAVFLLFLWRRQQGLVGQIDRLQRELDAALKDDKKAAT